MSILKKTLGELCFIEKGKIGIQKAIPGEYPLVVTAEERLSHDEYHFEGNAVVIPLVSSTGHGHKSLKRIHFQSGKFAVGNILCAVMPKDETILNAEYLYRFLDLNREKELVGRMKGMANVSLPLKEIALIEIPLPPVTEQLKFVEEYKQLETAKNKLDVEFTHQLSLVKQLRQSFLREAMQGKLTAEFRSANPELIAGENSAKALLEKIKAEKKKLIKDSKLKKEKELTPVSEDEIPFEIPESWVWCRLGEIAYNIEYGSSEKADLNSNNIPVLRMNNIQDGKIVFENLKYVKANIKDLPKLYLSNNDLLFNRTNSWELVGKSGVYHGENETMTFASYLIRIQFLEHISVDFINSYINSSFCRESQLEPNIIQQNGQANFNGTKLKNIISPLPPLSEQQVLVSKLDDLMRTCDELEASIRSSQGQNEMLLQQVLREALEG